MKGAIERRSRIREEHTLLLPGPPGIDESHLAVVVVRGELAARHGE